MANKRPTINLALTDLQAETLAQTLDAYLAGSKVPGARQQIIKLSDKLNKEIAASEARSV